MTLDEQIIRDELMDSLLTQVKIEGKPVCLYGDHNVDVTLALRKSGYEGHVYHHERPPNTIPRESKYLWVSTDEHDLRLYYGKGPKKG